MATFAETFDCLLLDLDGTVFCGHQPTPGALETLAQIPARTFWVTNNASRNAAQVAEHLASMGFRADPDDVVTSAQAGAALLAARLPVGARVLVVGSEALAGEITAVGLTPVRSYDEGPVAVVQGYAPTICWADLAEAALAIQAGALWVATNTDLTLPSDRGLLPGNGSLVAAVAAATGADPVVAGKPQPGLMHAALSRGNFSAPLVVGDRLNTDIAGANAAGLPSLAVLTGVVDARQLVNAVPEERPSYLTHDLRGLYGSIADARIGPHPAWRTEHDGDTVTVYATGEPDPDGLAVVRVVADALWSSSACGPASRVRPGDASAERALTRWTLLDAVAADRLA